MVQNPVPAAAVALLLSIPGIWLAGRWLARLAVDDLWLSRLTAPAFALATWLIAVHTVGVLFNSFELALWTGSFFVATAGFASDFLFRPKQPATDWTPTNTFWIGVALVAVAIAAVAFRWAIHDDLFVTGHMSITAAIQNGPYPPRNLSFPQYELRYHYGFDLLNAAVTSVFRMRIDVGIDVLTVVLGAWTFALLWAGGDRVLGHGRGWVAAVTVMLAGGMPLVCLPFGDTVAGVLLGMCSTGGINVNPPVMSYFFQHPWSVGLPIALVALFIFTSKAQASLRAALISPLLIALALCQAVLFVALAAGFVVAEFWQAGSTYHWRRATVVLLGSAVAVGISMALGGFFASHSHDSGLPFVLRPGIADGITSTVTWHLASFGLALPLGLLGILRAPHCRLRTLGMALVAASIILMNTVTYAHSWDIVKSGNLGLLVLAAAASISIADLITARARALAMMVFLLVAVGGLGFLLALAFSLPGVPQGHYPHSPAILAEADVEAIEWLRNEAVSSDVVYRSSPMNRAYAQWGGLPQAELDEMSGRLGLPATVLAQRSDLLNALPSAIEPYLAQRIRWIVLAPRDTIVNAIVVSWESADSAVERRRFGDLRIVEIGLGRRTMRED